MKKHAGKIAIITMLMVFMSSFGFISVFAEGSVQPAESAVLTAQEGETVPAAVADIETFSSYQSVVLEWAPSAGADKYYVNDNDVTSELKNVTIDGAQKLQYHTKKNLTPGKSYSFKVEAANSKGKSEAVTVKDAPVRTIKYKVKIKTSGTLHAHFGNKKATYKVTAGQWLTADRFGAGGKYIFDDKKGNTFYCDRLRTSSRKALYEKEWNYSAREAEFFVNDKGVSSKKKAMVWVNAYTQHIYLLEGKKGSWKCTLDAECSTGSASTPTPTGVNGLKVIYKKIRSRHNIPWWSPFSDINSIHGKKKAWKLGKPASNGCVRNFNPNAKKIYKTAIIKSKVLVY